MGLRCARSHPVLVLGVLGAAVTVFGIIRKWNCKDKSIAEDKVKARDVAAKRERYKAWDEDSEKQEEFVSSLTDEKGLSDVKQRSQSEAAEASEELQRAEVWSRDKKGLQISETSQDAAGGESISLGVPPSDSSLGWKGTKGAEDAAKAETSGPTSRFMGMKKGFLSTRGSKKRPLKADLFKVLQQAKATAGKPTTDCKKKSCEAEDDFPKASSEDTPKAGTGKEGKELSKEIEPKEIIERVKKKKVTKEGEKKEEKSQQRLARDYDIEKVRAEAESGTQETPKKEMLIDVQAALEQGKSPKGTPTTVLSFPDSPSSVDSPLPQSKSPLKKRLGKSRPKRSSARQMGGLLPLPQRPQRSNGKAQPDEEMAPAEKEERNGGVQALRAASPGTGSVKKETPSEKKCTGGAVADMNAQPASSPTKAHQQPSLLAWTDHKDGVSRKQGSKKYVLKPVLVNESVEKNVEDTSAKNCGQVEASQEALGPKETLQNGKSEGQKLGRQNSPVEDPSSEALKQSPPKEEKALQTAKETASNPDSSLSRGMDKASDLRNDLNTNIISNASQMGSFKPKDSFRDLESPSRVSEPVSQNQEPQIEELPTKIVTEVAIKNNTKRGSNCEAAIALAALAACAWCGRPLENKEEDDLPLCCMLALQKLQEERKKIEEEASVNIEKKKGASKSGPLDGLLNATEQRRQNGRQEVKDAKPKAARRLNMGKAARDAAEGTRWASKVRSWLEGKTDSGRAH